MAKNRLNRFFISIVLPSILAILFFVLLIFLVILPTTESNIMQGKKETISELTHSVWSLLEEYEQDVQRGVLDADSAKVLAAERIRQIRYGAEYKDYFWIISSEPRMIMHPYRPDLIGGSLLDYKDPNGKKLFVEAALLVAEKKEGYIDYYWQWKDDSLRIVPKLSYVKGFESWDWIVGTGIYLEDVRIEIHELTKKLLRTTLFFALLIGLILAIIIRQSLRIEWQRSAAEKRLSLSRQKYKSLVEASTEGTIMVLREEIIFANLKFAALSGYSVEELSGMNPVELLKEEWGLFQESFKDPTRSITREIILHTRNSNKEVIVTASSIRYADQSSIVLVFKEVSVSQALKKEADLLTEEMETALLLMNQVVKPIHREMISCDVACSIQQAGALMVKKESDVVYVTMEGSVVGLVNSRDLTERVIARNLATDVSIIKIMTAPVESVSEHSLLYEAVLKMKLKDVSHLLVLDASGNPVGVVGKEDIAGLQYNTVGFMVREIEQAEDVEKLAIIYRRLPVLIKVLNSSGHKTSLVNRIITSIADAFHQRVIELAMEVVGEAPVSFALMVLGSEGRGEQTLATDQDNALVYKDVPADREEDIRAYFQALAEKVNKGLDQIGYKFCKGEVMASNPRWSQGLNTWKKYFEGWIRNSMPQDILEVSIFFDFRCVYGDKSLISELRNHVKKLSDGQSLFHFHMAQSALGFKPPVNLFGNIVGKEAGEESSIDIKKAMIPITSYLRTFSIIDKLSETNSYERLDKLVELGRIDPETGEDIRQGYSFLMQLRIRSQVHSIQENETPGNIVNVASLSKSDLSNLKRVFSEISDLQSRLKLEFKGLE